MPKIPVESGGEIEFKFIPKSEGEGKKPATKKPSNWRSDFEKGLRFIFYSVIVLLGLYLAYQQFVSEPKSVSIANATQPSNVKSTEGDPWAQARDVNGDGFIEAWEGIK